MKPRPVISLRPLIVGGGAALMLSIIGAVLAGDTQNIWWHVGTIGSAVLISALLALAKPNQLMLGARLYFAISLAFISIIGLAYGLNFSGGLSNDSIIAALGNRNSVAAGVAVTGFISMLLIPKRRNLIAVLSILALLAVNSRASLIAFIVGFIVLLLTSTQQKRVAFWKMLSLGALVVFLGTLLFLPPVITDTIREYNKNDFDSIRPLDATNLSAWSFNQNANFEIDFGKDAVYGDVARISATFNPEADYPSVMLNQSTRQLGFESAAIASVMLRSDSTSQVLLSTNVDSHPCEVTTEWTRCETPLTPGNENVVMQFQLRYPEDISHIQLEIAAPMMHIIRSEQALSSSCQERCIVALRWLNKYISRFDVGAWSGEYNVTSRLEAQRFALLRFSEKPLTGFGLNTFAADFALTFPSIPIVDHPHSFIIQVLYERGLMGIVAVILLFAGILITVGPTRTVAISLLVFLFALQAMDSTFYFNLVFYPFWLGLSLTRVHKGDATASGTRAGETTRISNRFSHTLDAVIVAAGIYIAARSIPTVAGGDAFVYFLIAASIGAWLFTHRQSRRRSWVHYPDVLTVIQLPVLAAAFTLIFAVITRSYYSLTAIFLFITTVAFGLAFSRLVFRNMHPDLHVLLVGESAYFTEFERAPNTVTSAWTTHSRGRDFQFVILGEDISDPKKFQHWVAAQAKPKFVTWTALQALEALHGRVPAETVSAQWVEEKRLQMRSYLPYKRIIESVLITIFSPLVALVAAGTAILVFFSVGRPIIFMQERVGLHNKPFTIYKFRTMREGAKQQAAFADTETERITAVGRFLRAFRLDEIPQFWNVLLGDMSIIGPRPEQVEFAEQFESELPAYSARHIVRPGITGWAQVRQGYAAGADETLDKLSYDFFYIKHFSPWLDTVIVGRTILTILTRFGAK